MHHFTFRTLIEDSDCQLNVNIAHSVEYWHDDQQVLGSIPTGGNFCLIYFDLLHEFWQDSARISQKKSNYRKTQVTLSCVRSSQSFTMIT